MNAVEDAEQCGIDALSRPDRLVAWIDLGADRCPLGQGASVAEGIPEKEDRFALPVEEVWIIAVMRYEVLQPTGDFARAIESRRITLEVDRGGKVVVCAVFQRRR